MFLGFLRFLKFLYMKKLFLLFAFGLVLTSCEKEEKENEKTFETTMRINSYRETCEAMVETMCYLVQNGEQVGSDEWNLFYSEIEGFEYEEGFLYTLKVQIEEVAIPLEDGSDRKYTLLEVISKVKG